MKHKVSIIIPVAPGETLQKGLQEQLLTAPEDWEILICSNLGPEPSFFSNQRFRWVQSKTGRAESLNAGAGQANGDYLWFLHADSYLAVGAFDTLSRLAAMQKKDLYYFDLRFLRLSDHNVRPKEIGVLFRSRCLKTPFGDQGFFLKKELFEAYGPYSVEAAYGEDHLFVRKLRRNKIRITPIGMQIFTSPRKYEQKGWIRVTILYQYLWIKQAVQDWWLWRNESYENSNRSLL